MMSNPIQATSVQRSKMSSLPAFLTEAEKLRLVKIAEGRQLFRGKWREFLLTDGRTAHVFKAIRNTRGQDIPLLVTVNVLALASKKCADLMFLEPPGITAPEGFLDQQEAIDRINQASHSESVFYEAALTATYEMDAWIKVVRWHDKIIFQNCDAGTCFPVGEPNPDGSYDTVEQRWILSRGTGNAKQTYLRKEIHTAGRITNELYRLDKSGKISGRAELAEWYGEKAVNPSGEIPADVVETGIDEPLLQWVPNFMVSGECISDFDGVGELVDQFTAAISQAAGVIARHADPKMTMDEETGNALAHQASGGGDTDPYQTGNEGESKDRINISELGVLFTKDGLVKPEYLVWNAQLEVAIKLIDNWIEWLFAVIEMSPGLLGLRKGGAAEAWRKLRLEAANTLAKVARKILFWNRFIKDLYRIAHKLENTMPYYRYDHDEVSIDWNDGIPLDDQEETDTLVDQKTAGLIDRQSAVEKLFGPEKAETINARLDGEESKQRTLTMNMGGFSVAGSPEPVAGESGTPNSALRTANSDGGEV